MRSGASPRRPRGPSERPSALGAREVLALLLAAGLLAIATAVLTPPDVSMRTDDAGLFLTPGR